MFEVIFYKLLLMTTKCHFYIFNISAGKFLKTLIFAS
jgi:hypothetical protein